MPRCQPSCPGSSVLPRLVRPSRQGMDRTGLGRMDTRASGPPRGQLKDELLAAAAGRIRQAPREEDGRRSRRGCEARRLVGFRAERIDPGHAPAPPAGSAAPRRWHGPRRVAQRSSAPGGAAARHCTRQSSANVREDTAPRRALREPSAAAGDSDAARSRGARSPSLEKQRVSARCRHDGPGLSGTLVPAFGLRRDKRRRASPTRRRRRLPHPCRLGPKMAVPTLTIVAPSSTATSKSCVMPIDK